MRLLTLPCPQAYQRWRACLESIWCGSRSCESYRYTTKDSLRESLPSVSTYPARLLFGTSAPSKTKISCIQTRPTVAAIGCSTELTGRSLLWHSMTSARMFFLLTSGTALVLAEQFGKDDLLHHRSRVAISEIATSRYGGTMAGRKEIPDRAKKPIATRLRTPVDAVVKARADKLGMPWGEYCSYLIANAVDMPEFAPDLPESDDPQEALPLHKIA